jgi:hypothetical protein
MESQRSDRRRFFFSSFVRGELEGSSIRVSFAGAAAFVGVAVFTGTADFAGLAAFTGAAAEGFAATGALDS